jgi:hypothetical protein
MVWDRGYWDCEDPERAYAKGKLDFTLKVLIPDDIRGASESDAV